jgi:hypothetical protein
MNTGRCTWVRFIVAGAVVLVGLAVMAPSSAWPQASKPPVISLKAFTSVPQWVLDITWNAKDAYEDAEFSAGLELTVTARYYLEQLDREEGWGRWETRREQSSNIAYTGFLLDKRNGQRLEYKGTGGLLMDTAANLQIGGNTPGYQLVVEAMVPVKVTQSASPASESAIHLGTTQLGQVTKFCTGPLPAKGTAIHGSLVILADIPPFGTSRAPRTRVGIQYVLREHVPDLAPLVPPKKGSL